MTKAELELQIQCLLAEAEGNPSFGAVNWLDIQGLMEWFETPTKLDLVAKNDWSVSYYWDEEACLNVDFCHPNRRAGVFLDTLRPDKSGWWMASRLVDGSADPNDGAGSLDDTYIQVVLDRFFWDVP